MFVPNGNDRFTQLTESEGEMDQEHDIWFPAKRYGWGWGLPVKWQGWLAVTMYVAFMVIVAIRFSPITELSTFLALLLLGSVFFGFVCWWKGETPRWRWGEKER